MTHSSDPITINHLTLANRLVMPPMATAKADNNGHVTNAICAYYQERAKYSKIGLIITEHSYIHPQGKAHPGQTSLASDDVIPGLRQLTDCIHREGVRVFAQLSHAGSAAQSKLTGQPPVGPSPVYHPKQQEELPEEMTLAQIGQVTTWFAQAALRAKQAGFDGVELHSAHGYLLNQFFSPLPTTEPMITGPSRWKTASGSTGRSSRRCGRRWGQTIPSPCGWAATTRPGAAPLPTAWRPAVAWHRAAWICWTSPAA